MINRPTRVACNTSTLTAHILINTTNDIFQSGVVFASISDHSTVHCTRKIPKAKYNKRTELIFFSLKSCLIDIYKETLERVSFPNSENFDDPILNVNYVINTIAALKDMMKAYFC